INVKDKNSQLRSANRKLAHKVQYIQSLQSDLDNITNLYDNSNDFNADLTLSFQNLSTILSSALSDLADMEDDLSTCLFKSDKSIDDFAFLRTNFTLENNHLRALLSNSSQFLLSLQDDSDHLRTELASERAANSALKAQISELIQGQKKQSSVLSALQDRLGSLNPVLAVTTVSTTTTSTTTTIPELPQQPRKSSHKLQSLPISALQYHTPNWASPISDSTVIFSRIGSVVGSLDLVHIEFKFHLKPVISHLRYTCALIKGSSDFLANAGNNKAFYESLITALGQLCEDKLYELEEFQIAMTQSSIQEDKLQFLQKVAQHRTPRQADIVISAAVGAISALISSAILSDTDLLNLSAGTATSPLTIRTLQDHETRLSVNEHSIQVLEDVANDMIDNVATSNTDTNCINEILKLNYALALVTAEVDRLLLGLIQIHHHRLSPLLVDNSVLKDVIRELQLRIDRGLEMGITHVEDVF
ncbi:MAG: hypothetical protein AAGD96_29240, partial [Chloroflexota bacterium]